jgi:hypothetical protein
MASSGTRSLPTCPSRPRLGGRRSARFGRASPHHARRAHRRCSCRWRHAFRRTAQVLPRPRRHLVRPPRRPHRRRPRRQDRSRLPPRLATDSDTTDNHDERRLKRRLPIPLPGIPTERGNGNWEVRPARRCAPHACPSNALHARPSNYVITLTATPSPRRRSRPRVSDRPYPRARPSGQHRVVNFYAWRASVTGLASF